MVKKKFGKIDFFKSYILNVVLRILILMKNSEYRVIIIKFFLV